MAGSMRIQSTGAPWAALITVWWLNICSAIEYSPAMTSSRIWRADPPTLAMFCLASFCK